MAAPEKFNYAAKLAELKAVLEELETGELSFEDLIARYQTGQELLAACRAFIERTELETLEAAE